MVSVNGNKASETGADFQFKPTSAGDYELEFYADDGLEQSGTYTVNLKVEAKNLVTVNQSLADTTKFLAEAETTPTVGSIGGEWMIIGLARYHSLPEAMEEGYYNNVVEYVSKNINDKEQLHRSKSTDNSRVILGLTAIGKDVTNVGGHNLLKGLTDMTYIQKQGINGPIWALIALDSNNYEIPTCEAGQTQATREALVELVLSKQLDDGGWALSGNTADPDMTAMALQCLVPYYNTKEEVKTAVEKGITALSQIQLKDGGYASWGTTNSESIAQVLVALTSYGINPTTDERFIKDENTLLDALQFFACDGGGYAHTLQSAINGMATEQAYYAIVSYDRLLRGETRLYDMTDVFTLPKIIEGTEAQWSDEDTSEGLTFKSDADIRDFKGVLVDDLEVPTQHYTVTEGSTIVKVSPEFLSTLNDGPHKFSVVSKNGNADTNFTVKKASSSATEQQPNDETNQQLNEIQDTSKNTSQANNTEDTANGDNAKDKAAQAETAQNNTEQTNSTQTSTSNTDMVVLTSTTPKTSDETHLMVWITILIVMSAFIIGDVVKKKK
jgi:hypothetical protein